MNTVTELLSSFHSYEPWICPLEAMHIPQNGVSHPVKQYSKEISSLVVMQILHYFTFMSALIEGCNCKSQIQLINEPNEKYNKLGPQFSIMLVQMKLSIIFIIFFFLSCVV
jgi:hypothetical protein